MPNITLTEINAQIKEQEEKIAQLKAEAAAHRRNELASVIQELRERIAEYGISAKELGLSTGKAKPVRRPTLAESIARGAKYQGPNGETWIGGTRGRKPGWLTEELASGKTLEQLAV